MTTEVLKAIFKVAPGVIRRFMELAGTKFSWKSSWEDYTTVQWRMARSSEASEKKQTMESNPRYPPHFPFNPGHRPKYSLGSQFVFGGVTYKVFLFQIPAGYEVDEEVKPRVPDLDCGEEELLTHLLNIYDDDQEDEKVEDADSDDDSEAGPESDEDDDRIEDFIEEGNCAQATTDEAKECPD